MFSVEFSRKADKFVSVLPKDLSKRIVIAAESLGAEQFPRGAIKVKGEDNTFRVRVGDYRILYEIHADKQLILVTRIDKRSRVYENF